MPKIIIICGPTGIGKTSFSIALAKKFSGEIIGADSMQIYKYMNIGTAKPSKEEVDSAAHHLIDFVDPKVAFDAGQFVDHADKAIQEITARQKLPIVAGGTGLYIKALLHGLFRSKPICEKTMNRLNHMLENKGPAYMHDQLKQCDPDAAERIHANDSFRVLRALEVYQTTGKPISARHSEHGFDTKRYRYLKLGLKLEREKLYQRINVRVDEMITQGLLAEVRQLIEMGYDPGLKPMQSIGYKHMCMFIHGETDWDETIRLLKRDTRRYAKRQFTWFNQDKEVYWIEPDEIDQAKQLVKDFLT